MNWHLKIQEPSGEIRQIQLSKAISLGRSSESDVILRDPTVGLTVAQLSPSSNELQISSPHSGSRAQIPHPANSSPASSSFWLKMNQDAPAAMLADIPIRHAKIPLGIPFFIGETKLTIEPGASAKALPTFPAGIRPWMTCAESGRKTLWMTKKAAETPLSIYLAGETGTGKEVLAQLIHSWSPRRAGSFVPLHCGALPLSLAESELFGHVKGAFTGAHHHRTGALMQAHGGTLFLDEVGDLPLDIQVKLLRFLENGEIKPVGADRPSRVDVRILCATHKPLKKLVQEGKFRTDLYYRLASVTIDIPTLRSRPEDIELLSRKIAHELGQSISPKAIMRLQSYSWPGNVRELRHSIERASGIAGPFSKVLTEESFEFLLQPESISENPELELGAAVLTLAEMERVLLIRALKLSHGNRARSARILGVARSTLFEMLKRHRIPGPRFAYGNIKDTHVLQ